MLYDLIRYHDTSYQNDLHIKPKLPNLLNSTGNIEQFLTRQRVFIVSR